MTADERRAILLAPIRVRTIGGRGWSGASFAHIDISLKRGQGRSVYYDLDDRSTSYPDELIVNPSKE